jgi:hypothetical protein
MIKCRSIRLGAENVTSFSKLRSKYVHVIEVPDDQSIEYFTSNEGTLILCIVTVKAIALTQGRSLLKE